MKKAFPDKKLVTARHFVDGKPGPVPETQERLFIWLRGGKQVVNYGFNFREVKWEGETPVIETHCRTITGSGSFENLLRDHFGKAVK